MKIVGVGNRVERFREALRDVYSSRTDIDELLLTRLGVRLDDIVSDNAPLPEAILQVLRWADENGRAGALLEAAVRERPQRLLRHFLWQMWNENAWADEEPGLQLRLRARAMAQQGAPREIVEAWRAGPEAPAPDAGSVLRSDLWVSCAPDVPQQPLEEMLEALVRHMELRYGRPVLVASSRSAWRSPEEADVLLVLLSQEYGICATCKEELEAFLRAAGGSTLDSKPPLPRVFLVILGEAQTAPPPPSGLENFSVLSLSSRSTEFEGLLLQLVENVRSVSGALRRTAPAPVLDAALAGKVIVLAETTEDLDRDRETVYRYLEQRGAAVLPRSGTRYPLDAGPFDEAVKADLVRSDLFVQLLSEWPGRRPPDDAGTDAPTYVRRQFEFAVEHFGSMPEGRKRLFQWRRPSINAEAVPKEEAAHRRLLQGPSVQEAPLQEFMDGLRIPPPPPPRPPGGYVFVEFAPNDRVHVTTMIHPRLDALRFSYNLQPVEGSRPCEIREQLKQRIFGSRAAVLVYRDAGMTDWVNARLQMLSTVRATLDDEIPRLALYKGPPRPKVVSIRISDLQELDCYDNDTEFERFLQAL